jgi:prepilin-type N-terminal cleavage/methylation domain-containing protein
MKTKKGFTLIELFVAIAIISLLVGIIIVAVKEARVKTDDVRSVSDVQNIFKAAT